MGLAPAGVESICRSRLESRSMASTCSCCCLSFFSGIMSRSLRKTIVVVSRSGTGTHLSEQRRCSSAHGRRAAHVPKLWYAANCDAVNCDASLCIQSSVSSHMPLLVSKLRSVTVGKDHVTTSSASNQQAEKRHCRRGPCDHRPPFARWCRLRSCPGSRLR